MVQYLDPWTDVRSDPIEGDLTKERKVRWRLGAQGTEL